MTIFLMIMMMSKKKKMMTMTTNSNGGGDDDISNIANKKPDLRACRGREAGREAGEKDTL